MKEFLLEPAMLEDFGNSVLFSSPGGDVIRKVRLEHDWDIKVAQVLGLCVTLLQGQAA